MTSPRSENGDGGVSADPGDQDSRRVERWVRWLDDGFRIPGTRIRFGLDPVLGLLLPGLGDGVGAAGSMSVFLLALRERVPTRVLLRMLFNLVLDAALGSLPVFGDAFDFFFHANRRNLNLVRRHSEGLRYQGEVPRVLMRDRVLVALALMLALGSLAVSLALGWYAVDWLFGVR